MAEDHLLTYLQSMCRPSSGPINCRLSMDDRDVVFNVSENGAPRMHAIFVISLLLYPACHKGTRILRPSCGHRAHNLCRSNLM